MAENNETISDIKDTLSVGSDFKSYKYRWVVLILVMLVGAITQMVWVTYGLIIGETAIFFFGSFTDTNEILILLLSLIFMVVYIPVNFPACWIIDKLGLKWGTGIGVILTGVFGPLRILAIYLGNFWMLLAFQIMCAIGQPFVLNSFTKLAASWFPEKEKTLASGLGILSMLIGVLIAFVIPPFAVENNIPGGITWITIAFGIASFVGMVLYFIFMRDKPPTPPNAYADKTKTLAVKGTRSMFKNRDFNLLFIAIFIGGGAFNAISSVLDVIYGYEITDVQPGIIGGIMIGGGIVGAVVVSTLSDHLQKRKIFLIIAMIAGGIFSTLLYFIQADIGRYIISFFLGLFLVSALPVGLTFAAEITYPLPEETSNGIMMWINQIGGIILIGAIILTSELNVSLMYINVIVMGVLFVIGTVLTFFMKDLDAYKR